MGFFCKAALLVLIVFPPGGGFDFYGGDIPCGEIVGAGAHVDIPEFVGEAEGGEEECGADPWHAFCGPFVEVHVCVDAAGLLVEVACLEAGLEAV